MEVPKERVAACGAAEALPSQGRAQRVEILRLGVDIVADAVAVERYIPPVGHRGGCMLGSGHMLVMYQAPQSRLPN
jgi:hypothetical protein